MLPIQNVTWLHTDRWQSQTWHWVLEYELCCSHLHVELNQLLNSCLRVMY